MGNYNLEIMECFNSLNEDLSIWECRLMILEHNIMIQEYKAFDKVKNAFNNTTSKFVDKGKQGIDKMDNVQIDKKLDKEQKIKSGVETAKGLSQGKKQFVFREFKKRMIKFFKDLLAKFTGVFKKFKEVAIRMCKNDSVWLNKYKNTILSTDLSKLDYEHEMFPYWNGQQYLEKMTPRPLNKNDKEMMTALENPDDFKAYLVKKLIPIKSNEFKKGDFSDNYKSILRGGSAKKLRPAQLQDMLNGMIQYCEKYTEIGKNLNDEMNTIKRICEEGQREAAKIQDNVADPNANKENKLASESFLFLNEAYAFLEQVDDPASNKDIRDNNRQAQKEAKEKIDKQGHNPSNTSNPGVGGSGGSNQQQMSLVNKYRVYLSVTNQIFGTKMEILEEKYRAYMDLFKAIVNLGLYQSKETQKTGKSYHAKGNQIEDSKFLTEREKEKKRKLRQKMR